MEEKVVRGPCDTATQLRGKGGPGGYPFAGLGKGGEGHITWKKRQEEGEGGEGRGLLFRSKAKAGTG